MKTWTPFALLAAGTLVGCMAAGPDLAARPPSSADPPDSSAAPDSSATSPALPAGCAPLLLDPTDLRFGVTVQFTRLPTMPEITDLRQAAGLAHVLLALPAWPEGYDALMSLEELPPEADLIVLLPGYPPSREAAEAWNMVQARVRMVIVVDTPPPSPSVVADMNGMRGLERVIAEVDPPSRAGFERLQRPLSFRHVVD